MVKVWNSGTVSSARLTPDRAPLREPAVGGEDIKYRKIMSSCRLSTPEVGADFDTYQKAACPLAHMLVPLEQLKPPYGMIQPVDGCFPPDQGVPGSVSTELRALKYMDKINEGCQQLIASVSIENGCDKGSTRDTTYGGIRTAAWPQTHSTIPTKVKSIPRFITSLCALTIVLTLIHVFSFVRHTHRSLSGH